MSKKLTIEIATSDLKVLSNANYLLCIAKKIEGQEYDIVWRAFDKYLVSNSVSWTPDYKLLITNSFIDGQIPANTTESDPIKIGQKTIISDVGIFSSPETGEYPDSLEMINKYGVIYPGVVQSSTGIDNQTIIKPIYINQNANVTGVIKLKPIDKVLLWFQTNIKTSTMFSVPPTVQAKSETDFASQSFAIEVDMTKADNAKRKYENGKWITPS